MPLPSSGAISLDQMHVEAGGTSGTQCSINDADIRDMISKGSGVQMSFSEWYGASAGPIIESAGPSNYYSIMTSYWSVGGNAAYGTTPPSSIKAYSYQFSGGFWDVEAMVVTPSGWNNGNGWGTGIVNTIEGYPAFDPTAGSNIVYNGIADWYSYAGGFNASGGGVSQTGRQPNYYMTHTIYNTNGVATASYMTPYPYYGPVGGWYYFYKHGDTGAPISETNYNGYDFQPYRTESPVYPF